MLGGLSQSLQVGVEAGSRRTFAWVLDWPGWCRSGRGESEALAALAALAAYASRYRPVMVAAGATSLSGAAGGFQVTERLTGSMTTDFGVPGALATADAAALTAEAGQRLAVILAAAWELFGEVASPGPLDLSKGPRGGGRDLDQVVAHVLGADFVYARKLGLRFRAAVQDPKAVAALRHAVCRGLGSPATLRRGAKGWPPRYYARRAAWHVLDHAWEIQDRGGPIAGSQEVALANGR